ncbi:hypothetical protein QQP08_014690 [Theobroma cacao]|nr:hypothetical protein QQP08_014690 [Theobroma cacao]
MPDLRCITKSAVTAVGACKYRDIFLLKEGKIIAICEFRPSMEIMVVEDSGTNRFWFEKMNFAKQFDLQNYECDLVNSCNGLVCLSGVQEGSIYVCNPVLVLPYLLEAEIYTLGTGSWRSIGNALGEVPAPPQFKLDMLSFDRLRLGVFDGCLSACCYRANGAWELEICVTKDYGVKESWTTQFRINPYVTDCKTDYYYPLIFLKNGEILISFNDEFVVCYNLEKGSLRDTRIFRTMGEFTTIGYTPCFVSLDDFAKGEQISSCWLQFRNHGMTTFQPSQGLKGRELSILLAVSYGQLKL